MHCYEVTSRGPDVKRHCVHVPIVTQYPWGADGRLVLYTRSCVITSVADFDPEGDLLKNHRYHSVHGDIYVTFSSGCWKPIFS